MIIVPETTSLAIKRGRAVSLALYEQVKEHRAAGRDPLEVRVSREVAADMRAFFAVAYQHFDNILPDNVDGVPFREGETDGKDVVIRVA